MCNTILFVIFGSIFYEDHIDKLYNVTDLHKFF